VRADAYVLVGNGNNRFECSVRDAELVIVMLQKSRETVTKYFDSLSLSKLVYDNAGKPPVERRVSEQSSALLKSGSADAVEITTSKSRLQYLSKFLIMVALRYQLVDLVYEKNDLVFGVGRKVDNRLQLLLKLSYKTAS